MDNNTENTEQDVSSEDTQVEVERTTEPKSIRDALNEAFDADEEALKLEPQVVEPDSKVEDSQHVAPTPATEHVNVVPLVPPADMNKAEKEAYLNPTPQNAHILQQYMNRRAYETRSDYQRKMQEVETLKAQAAPLYDTLKQYENDYARYGISLSDIAKRSVAWDQAMQKDPVQTALEWLDSYGLTVADLTQTNGQPYQYQSPVEQAPSLTREEAERIAEEKFQAMKAQQDQNAVAYYNERIVESFVKSKPLFKDAETASQLETEMAPIVQALTSSGRYSSPEEILETAYNYVVNGNPTFSSINNAIAAKATLEQKQVAAQKAKSAARSISGSPGSGTPRVQTKNIRDNLQRRMSGE
jgi:antitoxin component HigA of HigAB toxin-antitoxin module